MRRLFRDGGAIKVSRTLKELSLKVTRTREHLSASLGRDPPSGNWPRPWTSGRRDVVEALNVSPLPSLTESDDEGGGQIDLPVPPRGRISDLLSLKQVVGQLPPEGPGLIVLRCFSGKTKPRPLQVLGLPRCRSPAGRKNPHLPKGKTPGMRLTPLPSSGTIGANDDKGGPFYDQTLYP